MIDDINKDASTRMGKSIDSLKQTFAKMRTGRAHPSLLEHIKVSYYGNEVPLSQAATVNAYDARTLVIAPWEKNMISVVEKAILTSDLGLNPSTAGNVIRVALPPLTEERRKEMIKVAKAEAEASRVAIRNIRRDAISDIKELLKEKEITEDDDRRAQDEIQKITDRYIADVENCLTDKEKDLMEI
ncbi:MAG: ribosome recycling factor [Gammaproteobacteria bacterium]